MKNCVDYKFSSLCHESKYLTLYCPTNGFGPWENSACIDSNAFKPTLFKFSHDQWHDFQLTKILAKQSQKNMFCVKIIKMEFY